MYEIQLRIYRSSADNYQILWNDGIHLLDTGKPILGQNFVNRINIYIYIYYNGSSLSGDDAINFAIKIERPSAAVKNKSSLTILSI